MTAAKLIKLLPTPAPHNSDVQLVCVTASGAQFHFTDTSVIRMTNNDVESWGFPGGADAIFSHLLAQADRKYRTALPARVETVVQALIDRPESTLIDYYPTGEIVLSIVESRFRRFMSRLCAPLHRYRRFRWFRPRSVYMGKIRPGNVHRYSATT